MRSIAQRGFFGIPLVIKRPETHCFRYAVKKASASVAGGNACRGRSRPSRMGQYAQSKEQALVRRIRKIRVFPKPRSESERMLIGSRGTRVRQPSERSLSDPFPSYHEGPATSGRESFARCP